MMIGQLFAHSKCISTSYKNIEIITISDHLRENQNRINTPLENKQIDTFNDQIVTLDNIIINKDKKNIYVWNKTVNESTRHNHKGQVSKAVPIVDTFRGNIVENNQNQIKENLSKYAQSQHSTTMDNADGQTRSIMKLDIYFSPGGINYKSSLFKATPFTWANTFKSENHAKRFRRQSPLAFAIAGSLADLNQIGLTDPGNVQGAPLALGGGGFIFGGPAVLGSILSSGFSIYDTDVGILDFAIPVAPSPVTTTTTTTVSTIPQPQTTSIA